MKTCDMCHRHVEDAAVTCPFCGHQFAPVAAPIVPEIRDIAPLPAYGMPPTRNPVLIGTVSLAVIGGALIAWYLLNR